MTNSRLSKKIWVSYHGSITIISSNNSNLDTSKQQVKNLMKSDHSDCRYSEIDNWDFNTSSRRAGSTGLTGHFTQMVWRETTEVGYGFAIADSPKFKPRKIVFVVAKYRKPGNSHIVGEKEASYRANVGPVEGGYC